MPRTALHKRQRTAKKLRARARDKAQAAADRALRPRPDLAAMFEPLVPPPPSDPAERFGLMMAAVQKKVTEARRGVSA